MTAEIKNLYGVNLLVALLTRLPKLDEVELKTEDQTIGFSIYFKPQTDSAAFFELFKEEYKKIASAYSHLEIVSPSKSDAEMTSLGSGWWKITLWVAIGELHLSFVLLLVEWWSEFFADCELAVNLLTEILTEDEKYFQEEMIENMLQFLKSETKGEPLRGFRDGQDILVFPKNKS